MFTKALYVHKKTRDTHIFFNIEYDRSYVVVQIYYSNDSNVVNGNFRLKNFYKITLYP
jgi:hypothetical protein